MKQVPTVIEHNSNDALGIGGAYEGADRTSREIALWAPPIRSADGDMHGEKHLIDARSRDRSQNDGYVSGAVQINKDSIVGGQYLLNSKPNLNFLRLINSSFDEDWMDEFQTVVEARFNMYGESNSNYMDAAGTKSFTDLIRLGVGVYVVSGEVLATAEWLRGNRPYSTAMQMIDVDRLTNPNDRLDSNRLRKGVEKNRQGAPIAYHIRERHPGDWFYVGGDAYSWRRVPATKPWGRSQVLHMYEASRPDQTRGVSEMVSVLKQMRMTSRFQDVALQSAVINATYAATIESELPSDAVFEQLGASRGNNSQTTWAQRYLSDISKYVGSSNNIHIDGAKIPHLYPGTKLNVRSPAPPGGVGNNFEQSLLRHIASGLGLSYEEFTRDFTKTNYSSAKAGLNITGKRMQARKKLVADRMANWAYQLWFEEALNKGDIPMPSGIDERFFYEGQNKDALTKASWIGASRGQIDEQKETLAAALRIETGLSTLEEECAKLGRDYRDIITQRVREKRLLEQHGLSTAPVGSGKERDQNDDEQDEQDDGLDD